ncbi:MAG: type II toxin-antitoxin system VapC family toxin [Rhodanobacter sp.]|nr:type II toxin-antitoxin system VapC family toxin [Rhodanobacter sp.]
MIVLDTNIASELMRAWPEQRVLAWLDAQTSGDLFLTAISVAEILWGVARLPDGKRKQRMLEAAQTMFMEDFHERLLAFDEHSAVQYAQVVARRQSIGRPISMADAQIAAICLHHQAALATRNLKDFEAAGLDLVNPWLLQSHN